jgi:hypothetical protein
VVDKVRSVEEVRAKPKGMFWPSFGLALLVFALLIAWFVIIPTITLGLLEDSVGRPWGSVFAGLWLATSFISIMALAFRWFLHKLVDRHVVESREVDG